MFASKILPLGDIDQALANAIAAFPAIDQHAHPLAVGFELPGDPERPIQPYDVKLPLRMRTENPEYLDAWASLWGYEERDWSAPNLARLIDHKQSIMAEQGLNYNVWVLDQLNIETMIGIAAGPSASEPPPRFQWCAFSDWFLWPFPLADRELSGMQKNYRATNDRWTGEFSPAGPPQTLDRYVEVVLEGTLDRYKEQGAIGIKFHGPYNRPLNFDEVLLDEARALYDRGLQHGDLALSDHKALQDFLFERLVKSAGDRGFVVQIHTGYGVCEGFNVAGSNPLLMERIFHKVKNTNFVLLHGGWPFVDETVALLANDNVYTDFSCGCLFHYARSLSRQIRSALEWYPEKILYGTDAYSERSIALLGGLPFLANPLAGWEEKAWLMDRTGRTALSLALSGMHADGEVSAVRIDELTRMVMGGTASRLYGLIPTSETEPQLPA